MKRFCLACLLIVAIPLWATAAGLNLRTPSGEIAVSSSTTKTVLMITAPTHQKLRIKAFSVSLDGTDGTQSPAIVELMRFTSSGTFTSITPVKLYQSDGETPQATAGKDASSEPSADVVYLNREVGFAGGSFTYIYPFGNELVIKGGDRVGLRVTNTSSTTAVNVLPEIIYEE